MLSPSGGGKLNFPCPHSPGPCSMSPFPLVLAPWPPSLGLCFLNQVIYQSPCLATFTNTVNWLPRREMKLRRAAWRCLDSKETLSWVFDISSQSRLQLRKKIKIKIDIQYRYGHCFPCLSASPYLALDFGFLNPLLCSFKKLKVKIRKITRGTF